MPTEIYTQTNKIKQDKTKHTKCLHVALNALRSMAPDNVTSGNNDSSQIQICSCQTSLFNVPSTHDALSYYELQSHGMILSSNCYCSTLAEMPIVGGWSEKTEICDICTSVGTVFVVECRRKCFDLEKGSV